MWARRPSVDGYVQVELPSFTTLDPELWFSLADIIFEKAGVTDNYDKYSHILRSLKQQDLVDLKDAIRNPAELDYDEFVNDIIEDSTSLVDTDKRSFLREHIHNRKPSEFLRYLKELAGPTVCEDVMRKFWSDRLPQEIKKKLNARDDLSLNDLADLADSMVAGSIPKKPDIEFVMKELRIVSILMNEIRKELKDIKSTLSREHSLSRYRDRSQSPPRKHTESKG